MDASRPLEFLLKRDRTLVLAAIIGISALAWSYMAHEARAMYATGSCCCAGMTMSGPDTNPWSVTTLLPLFLMWAEMMIAMMLPTAAPMILTFAMVQRKRREQERPFISTGIFAAGYLLVWTGFSAVAGLAQWILHGKALLSPMMVSNSAALGGTLLVVAGIFQFAPFKNKCLSHCRSPLNFLMTGWREGKLGALRMGLSHGLHCTGCCWFLMLLLFVAGVMNLWWIAILTAFVLVEKLLPQTRGFSRFSGVALLLWGSWLLLGQGS